MGFPWEVTLVSGWAFALAKHGAVLYKILDFQVTLQAVQVVYRASPPITTQPCRLSYGCSFSGGSWWPKWREQQPSSGAERRPEPGRVTSPESGPERLSNHKLCTADLYQPRNSILWPESTDLQRREYILRVIWLRVILAATVSAGVLGRAQSVLEQASCRSDQHLIL